MAASGAKPASLSEQSPRPGAARSGLPEKVPSLRRPRPTFSHARRTRPKFGTREKVRSLSSPKNRKAPALQTRPKFTTREKVASLKPPGNRKAEELRTRPKLTTREKVPSLSSPRNRTPPGGPAQQRFQRLQPLRASSPARRPRNSTRRSRTTSSGPLDVRSKFEAQEAAKRGPPSRRPDPGALNRSGHFRPPRGPETRPPRRLAGC